MLDMHYVIRWSPLQSVGSIKESIWLTFAQTVRFYCAILVLLYSVFLNCIFLCMYIHVSCATLINDDDDDDKFVCMYVYVRPQHRTRL